MSKPTRLIANADKHVLFSATDGPESIEIYTSENEGVIDWNKSFPALYLTASTNGAAVKLGPFQLREIYEKVWRATDGQAHAKPETPALPAPSPSPAPGRQRLETDMLTEHQARMQELPMSVGWFRHQRLVKTGPPHQHIGRRIFYRRGDLRVWIAAQNKEALE